jgi:hypothetical protein
LRHWPEKGIEKGIDNSGGGNKVLVTDGVEIENVQEFI